jgi:hypothetical protein
VLPPAGSDKVKSQQKTLPQIPILKALDETFCTQEISTEDINCLLKMFAPKNRSPSQLLMNVYSLNLHKSFMHVLQKGRHVDS